MQCYRNHLYKHLTSSEKKEISIYTSNTEDEEGKECESDSNCCHNLGRRRTVLIKICQDENFTNSLLSLGQIHLPDSALYFFTNFHRFLSLDFLPTNEDIIRMRQSTTGVVEITVPYGGRSLRLIDVGGQRAERRKWINCFEDVTSILFIASLAGYNLTLVEDPSTNRLAESIALFKTILGSKMFDRQSVILLLNKMDIFERKISSFGLKESFADYRGKFNDKEDAHEFILSKFVGRRRSLIYTHQTTAVDLSDIRQVFSDVKHTIFNNCIENIARLGLF